jgi:formylglycine-generating enzyme required for sulfatase activity
MPSWVGLGLVLALGAPDASDAANARKAVKPGDPTPCGPARADMACIPPGPFLRGTNRGHKDERPQQTLDLDAYFIDRTETTIADYTTCMKAGACEKAGPNYRGFSEPKMPATGINWFEARTYCRWAGKRLPTEAEWEKAARTTDGRTYPWGEERADCTHAIIDENIEEGSPNNGCGTGKIFNVASRAPNPYGLYDMSGNAWEWVNDWYSPNYADCGPDCAGKNPKGPCGGADTCPGHEERIVRGGSWFWSYQWCTTTRRRPHTPENHPFHHMGFRCARDADAPADASPDGGAPAAPPALPPDAGPHG